MSTDNDTSMILPCGEKDRDQMQVCRKYNFKHTISIFILTSAFQEARWNLPYMQTRFHLLFHALQCSPCCPLRKFKHLNLVSNPDLVFTYLFSWYLVTVARPESFQFPKFILLLASICITFSKSDWLKQGCAAQCLPVACLGWGRERDLNCSFKKKIFFYYYFFIYFY